MEFLSTNLYNTSTAITVTSATDTAYFLFNPDIRRQFVSSGDADDNTTTTITISFDATQTIDRIIIKEHNIEAMNIFYGGTTANTFALTTTAGLTTVSQFASLAVSDLFLQFTAQAVTSVTFDLKATQVANVEKAVGFIYIGYQELDFERVPSSDGYKISKDPKEFMHELADGGTRRQVVDTKWKAQIKFKYITETFRNSLFNIWDQQNSKYFVPFGTGTGWDGIAFECVWTGNFDFYTYSDDAEQAGFSGKIELKET